MPCLLAVFKVAGEPPSSRFEAAASVSPCILGRVCFHCAIKTAGFYSSRSWPKPAKVQKRGKSNRSSLISSWYMCTCKYVNFT